MIKEIVRRSSRVSILGVASMWIGAHPVWAQGGAQAGAQVEAQAEIAELRAEVEKLLARVAELEARQAASASASVAVAAATAAPPVAKPAEVTWRWSGDVRYRHETLELGSDPNRQRDRIRARIGFTADVGEGVSAVVRVATSDGLDPRSANVTLDQLGERKTIGVDLAYLRWQPGGAGSDWQLTAGKMPTPWRVTPGFFHDTDVNPEGLAIAWQSGKTGPFASLFYLSLLERKTDRDSTLLGGQVGYRPTPEWTFALGYFDYQTVQGGDPFLDRDPAAAFGNSLTTLGCRSGVSRCLAQDFDVLQAQVDYRTERWAWPLRVHAEYGRNLAFDADIASTLTRYRAGAGDEAYSLGFTVGEARAAGGIAYSVLYQDVERDALFAPWLDADVASGFSAASGTILRVAYALTPRWILNANWFDAERHLEGEAGERREQRLHLDVSARF